MIKRRNVLKILAGGALVGVIASRQDYEFEWRGVAFGADVSLKIRGEPERASAAMYAVRNEIEAIEAIFSLYRLDSEISLLNAGKLTTPGPRLLEVAGLADYVRNESFGQFDVSLGGVWHSRATGRKVRNNLLTFNGIAQGYASDRISQLLADYGFKKTLVNMGEFVAQEGKWRLGATTGLFQLERAAAATSHVDALQFSDGSSHIISPTGRKHFWREVTVVADSGARADAWSTAMILMRENEIRHVHAKREVQRVFAINTAGKSLIL